MKRLGIKYQILLITLIPVFLIDVFFTYIHFGSDIAQANELLQSKGQIIAKQLAGASEFNLISGNDAQIQRMLEQTIDTNAIIRASVFDKQGKPIAESESKEYQDSNVASYLYYRYPIMSRSTTHPDVFAPDQVADTEVTTIGWVSIYIPRAARSIKSTNNPGFDSFFRHRIGAVRDTDCSYQPTHNTTGIYPG